MKKMVSIVTPMYNCEKYIEKYFESIISQTYHELEVIIVDDGSTDNSAEIAKKYAKNDNRINYYYQKNQGASSARNIGVKKATGEYLIFVDSDDYLEFNAIEIVVKKIESEKTDVVCFAHYKTYNGTKESFLFDWDCSKCYSSEFTVEQILNFKIKGYICDKLFKLKIWKKLNLSFEDKRYCEDWAPITEYIGNARAVSFVNTPLYYYVQHKSSSIHTSNIKVIKDYDYAINQILALECVKKQSFENITFFKTMAQLEIIHELYNIAVRTKKSIYKLAQNNSLPGFCVTAKMLFLNKITINMKIKMIFWKLHLYSLIKYLC